MRPGQATDSSCALLAEKALRGGISALQDAFAQDELAFLAATSKVELPVRDRLAWMIHKGVGDDSVISREWRRADLAILVDDQVAAQVEAKALYAFDVLREGKRKEFLGRLVSDATKMSSLVKSDRYLLSIIVDVRGEIRPELSQYVVKYAPGITAGTKLTQGGDVRSTAHSLWLGELVGAFGDVTQVTLIEAGRVWGLDVTVDLFLTGPLTDDDPASVKPGGR